jgi:purine-nucleoside phosphorylase
MSLAHLKCSPDDIAPYVLLPGDPDRARRIAERHLVDAKLVTDHRQMLGFTGSWKGVPVTVQTSGMGCPSAAIVVEELCQLGARAILRVGSCGALQPEIELGDLIIATGACSLNGTTERLVELPGYAPVADFDLARLAWSRARAMGSPFHAGLVGSSDIFYERNTTVFDKLRSFGVLALEMEASAVFTIAARERVRAGCLLLVSDLIPSGARISDDGKDEAVDRMTVVALDAFAALDQAGR